MPADRITKFLKMLQRELRVRKETEKELNVVEEMQIKEIEYALKNLNKRQIFKAGMQKVDSLQISEL